jgi:YggT family protein
MFIQWIAGLVVWLLIFNVITEWLIHFRILNSSQYIVAIIADFLFKMTNPILKPIRRFLPPYSGLDFSPLIAIFALFIIKDLINILIMNI